MREFASSENPTVELPQKAGLRSRVGNCKSPHHYSARSDLPRAVRNGGGEKEREGRALDEKCSLQRTARKFKGW